MSKPTAWTDDGYRKTFRCGEIVLDEEFEPQPFSVEKAIAGERPVG